FYLMIPLGKAMRTRTGRNYLLYVLTIVAGATMTHSLVPPTPGPMFVAEELGVSLGIMILMGCLVGAVTAAVGYVYAHVISRVWDLPLRESADLSLAELEAISRREDRDLPPLWLALAPILLPVILISGWTIVEALSQDESFQQRIASADLTEEMQQLLPIAEGLGDKNIALTISAALAMLMLVLQIRRGAREPEAAAHSVGDARFDRPTLQQLAIAVEGALASGGLIILITSAGGAFGAVLQQTGIAGMIERLPDVGPMMIITLAWLITAAIRTAQGSATVAMITAVGVLGGFSDPATLGCHPVWLALAIGSGSKPIGWMNDSGFWVITKMSGMSEAEGLKYVTPMTSLMGVAGLGTVLLGVRFFPMLWQ
ncbi:MAG: GntP family permease, partial [Planctomycetaceae bacterium]